MLFVVEERHEGEKYNNDFGGRGLGVGGHRGEGIDMSTMEKRGSAPTLLSTLIVYRL